VCEAVLGDLHEEFSLRARISRRHAERWYWLQAFRSLPGLCASRARQERWISTAAIAVVAYPVVGVFNAVGVAVLARWLGASATSYPATAMIGLAAIGAGAHVASRIRASAGRLLGGFVMIAALTFLVFPVDASPVWYQLTFLIVGPLSAHLGSTLAAVRRRRDTR
jgi:hypothetical protein